MKKILLISGITIVCLFIFVLLIPILFKGTLLEKTKTTLNKNLKAEVEFSDFNLSLLKKFPRITIELKDFVVKGNNQFNNDTLISVPYLRSSMQFFSLFKSGEKSLEEIEVGDASVNLLVNREGKTNWDIFPVSENTTSGTGTGESGFRLQLKSVSIKNATVLYTDKSIETVVAFKKVDLGLSGKMYGNQTDLKVKGTIDDFSVIYDSVTYISKTRLETTSLLRIDYDKINISVLENELLVNKLPLEIKGDINMPDSIWFDLSVRSKTSEFRNFLDLVPPVYEQYLTGLKATGNASVTGIIKGWLTDTEYPMTDISIAVSNGQVKYNNLPGDIRNIDAALVIRKPQGDLNATEIRINGAHAEISNNPVNLNLLLKNLTSDPFFEGSFAGKINFDKLREAVPVDSLGITGEMDANLFVKGNYSAIEKELYDQIKIDGSVSLSQFEYSGAQFTRLISIPSGKLDFSPASVNLKELKMKVGDSDFNLSGAVSGYLNYLFKQGILSGTLNLNSSFVNVNQLMTLQAKPAIVAQPESGKKTVPDAGRESEAKPFDVPGRIDFTFRSAIAKAKFENLDISDINGVIVVRDGKLNLEGLNMHLLDGSLNLAGSYQNNSTNMPLVSFNFDINEFDIPMAFRSLISVQRMFPVAGNTNGKLSTRFTIQGQLSPEMKFVSQSIDGSGLFLTKGIQIIDSPVFEQMKGILKKEKLRDIKVDDFTANFTVDKGNLLLKPFKTKISGQETTVYGKLNPESILDLRMEFNIDRNAFGPDIESILSILPGQENISRIPATVLVTGPVNKPEVKLDLSQAKKNISAEVKKSTSEGLHKTINKLGESLKKLIK
jgi:hypothetical protein